MMFDEMCITLDVRCTCILTSTRKLQTDSELNFPILLLLKLGHGVQASHYMYIQKLPS